MEYLIGAVIFLVCFFAGGIYLQKRAEKTTIEKIRKNFGLVPEIEFSYEKYQSIGYYFREMMKKHPEDDYWHRNIWRSEAGAAKTEKRTVKPDTERQDSAEQDSRKAEVTDEEGH